MGCVPHGPSGETNYDRIIEAYRRQFEAYRRQCQVGRSSTGSNSAT